MTVSDLFNLIRGKKSAIILAGLLFASVAFWISMLFSGSFKGKTDLLVVQNQEGFVDYYALSKSADYLSKVLTESIHSERFIEEMGKTGTVDIDEILPVKKNERLKQWKKIVKVKRKADTGVLSVEILGDGPVEVSKISQGFINVITQKGDLFLGRGQNLNVRVLSGPIIEKRLGILEIVSICVGGFLIGALLLIMFIYYKSQIKISNFKKAEKENSPQTGSVRNISDEEKNYFENKENFNNTSWQGDAENQQEPDDLEVKERLSQLLKV